MARDPRLGDASFEAFSNVPVGFAIALIGSGDGGFVRKYAAAARCGHPELTQDVGRTGRWWTVSSSRATNMHSRNVWVIVAL